MKLMIASDIHGAAGFCRALLDAYGREAPDRLLLLGDLLYHGPRNDLPPEYAPKAVIEMLNRLSRRLLCVRGNCEADVDQMVLDFPVLAEYAWLEVNGLRIFATHGHRHTKNDPPPLSDGDILLCGHTHVPACEERDGHLYINPGSVSIPKENSEQSYILATDGLLEWKNLDSVVYSRYEL